MCFHREWCANLLRRNWQNKEKLREFVADNECEECGHLGVSINAEFYPIGKCCYCGNEK